MFYRYRFFTNGEGMRTTPSRIFHRNFWASFMIDTVGMDLRHRLNVDQLMWSTRLPAHRVRLAEQPRHDRAQLPRRPEGRSQEDAARQLPPPLQARPRARHPRLDLRTERTAASRVSPLRSERRSTSRSEGSESGYPDSPGRPMNRSGPLEREPDLRGNCWLVFDQLAWIAAPVGETAPQLGDAGADGVARLGVAGVEVQKVPGVGDLAVRAPDLRGVEPGAGGRCAVGHEGRPHVRARSGARAGRALVLLELVEGATVRVDEDARRAWRRSSPCTVAFAGAAGVAGRRGGASLIVKGTVTRLEITSSPVAGTTAGAVPFTT